MKFENIQFGEQFKIYGKWWLPQYQDNQVTGEISYDSGEGLVLNVFDSLLPITDTMLKLNTRYFEVIFGICENGMKVTLHKCNQISMRTNLGGYDSQTIRAAKGFFGHHIKDPIAQEFQSISFSITNLEDWLGDSPIDETWYNFGFNEGQDLFLKFNPPKHFSIFSKSLNAKLVSGHNMATSSENGLYDRHWKYTAQLTLTPSEPKDYSWFVKHISELKNLLSLLIGKNLYFKFLKFYTADSFEKPIYTLFTQFVPKAKYSVHPSEMLAPYKSFTSEIESIFDLWFQNNQKFGPVNDLLFSVMHKQDLYIQSKLLHLLQAVETLHRRLFDGQYVSENEYDSIYVKLLSVIPENVDSNFKEVIQGRLKYMNEMSLRSRLKKLVSDLPLDLKNRFFSNRKFVNELCEIRDYLTHYGKNSKPTSTSDVSFKYFSMVQQLTIILSYYLLREVKIPDSILSQSLIEKYNYLKTN